MSLFFYIFLEITLFEMIADGSGLKTMVLTEVFLICLIVPDPYWGFDQL